MTATYKLSFSQKMQPGIFFKAYKEKKVTNQWEFFILNGPSTKSSSRTGKVYRIFHPEEYIKAILNIKET